MTPSPIRLLPHPGDLNWDDERLLSFDKHALFGRRAGGGGGRGGGGGVSSGGGRSGGSSSGGGGSSSTGGRTTSGFQPGTVTGGSSVYGSSAANGVRTPYTVTSGVGAGRVAGGGTRGDVYGSRAYGSGYPAGAAAGAGAGAFAGGSVASRGYPFLFFPLAFTAVPFWYGSHAYLNDADRPGGPLTLYVLQAPAGVNQSDNNLAIYGDANSAASVWTSLQRDCQVGPTLQPNFTVLPEQAVQYYRASSFSLMLNGYNNSLPNITVNADGTSNDTVTQQPAPLPSTLNMTYLNCLNDSIGRNVPLLDDSAVNAASSTFGSAQGMLGLAPTLALLLFMLQWIAH